MRIALLVIGVVFVSVLTNIMVLSGLTFGVQQMVIGALIVAAVSVDALARKAPRLRDYLDHHLPFYDRLRQHALKPRPSGG